MLYIQNKCLHAFVLRRRYEKTLPNIVRKLLVHKGIVYHFNN